MSILVTPPFGSTYKSIGTFNYTTALSSSITDSGDDALCGPGFSVYGCTDSGDPFYAQQALRNNAPGTWEVVGVPPVPEPSSLLLVGAALIGLAARRRLR